MTGRKLRFGLRIDITEGACWSRGYGVAYRLDWDRIAVCYPVPLNLVVHFFRELYFSLRFIKKSDRERELSKAYHAGRRAGWRAGRANILWHLRNTDDSLEVRESFGENWAEIDDD